MIESRSGLYTKRGGRVPLLGVAVEGTVVGGHAQVKVRQRYVNAEPKPIEAVYTFPLPSDATLTDFEMRCAGRRLTGLVKTRDEAFRDYDEAVSRGHGAALLDQERPNVFTAQVGNLLPDEETLIEVTYVQRLRADEGVLRWTVPTLVAPRYIPGTPSGDRTGHGVAEPTDRVPDADRITPPIGHVDYGLSLDLVFDLGEGIQVESPSHAIRATTEADGKVRVRFAQGEVALDRDVVLTARNVGEGPITAVAAHKEAERSGAFALTVVPDLFDPAVRAAPQQIVFVVDISGSMEGASIGEAKRALKLCLRHLREGDRFNIIAFNEIAWSFSSDLVGFGQQTLEQADRWTDALEADGGTEMLPPLLDAVRMVKDGLVVLLTDGQVGNEREILREVLAARGRARVYSFGIGTNVSDALLRDLATETSGAVAFIYPGERIDETVTAQFARAIAPRVEEVTVTFDGVEVQELAPGALPPLVDGEPWVLFGRYLGGGRGRMSLRGVRRDGGTEGTEFSLSVPFELPELHDAPWVEKLWARERIRDLERAELQGRRAEANVERIQKLAVKYGIVTSWTSFVVVEQRTGDRLATGQPETRVVPVNVPAGWDMFRRPLVRLRMGAAAMPGAPMSPPRSVAASGVLRPAAKLVASAVRGFAAHGPAGDEAVLSVSTSVSEPAPASGVEVTSRREAPAEAPWLERQLASGLWAPEGGATDDVALALATARALLELLRLGITTSHPVHGAQVRKAVTALTGLLPRVFRVNARVAELAAGVAWLVAQGPRSRGELERALGQESGLAALRGGFDDEVALRTRVDALSGALS